MPSARSSENHSPRTLRITLFALVVSIMLGALAIDRAPAVRSASHQAAGPDLVPSNFTFSLATPDPWAMLGGDAQHTSRSSFVGPQAFLTPNVFDVAQGGISSSVVIDGNGTVYLCSNDVQNISRLYALNADGTVRAGWPFVRQGPPFGSPAIGPDGTIYATFDRELYALNPDGTQKWPTP